MNKNNDDKIIRDMYEKIDTPDYDVSNDVIEKIHPKYHQKVVLKRVLIVAIILCLCVAALGAARIFGWQSYNLYGEKTGSGSPILPAITIPPGYESEGYTPIKRATQPPEDPEVIAYDRQFMENNANDEIRIHMTACGNAGYRADGSNSGIITDDYYIITDIMSINKSPIKLPSYIPEGYSFIEGKIDFYIDENSHPELISSEKKNNQMYLIYKLQEGYKENVSSLKITYSNKKGDIINYDTTLSEASMDNLEYYFPDSAVIESLEISSFDNAIWVYDKKNTYYRNSLALFKYIPHINTISLMNTTYSSIDNTHTSAYPTNAPEQQIENSPVISIGCHISSDVLSVEELIKIAKSLN